ncbi:unnamed protein product [Caenorhabditis sp. 36 PRJEB53466]|nr:unnamed protein product [Caenorhabditis sp. 36 PRJEB53466]
MEGRKRRRRGDNFSTFFRLSGEKTESDDSSESEGGHEEIIGIDVNCRSDSSILSSSDGENTDEFPETVERTIWDQMDISSNEGEQDDRSVSVDYRLIAYVNFYLDEGISAGTMKRMDSLMCIIYGHESSVTHKHVLKWIKEREKRFVKAIRYYCNMCGVEKAGKRDRCVQCRRHQSVLLGTATFLHTRFENQLELVLKNRGVDILNAHDRIRAGANDFQPHDIRRFRGYQQMIETQEESQRGVVNLICTLSSDAARFRRLSKREATPVLLRLEGLNLDDKASGMSMSLVGLVFADGGVKKHLVDEFVELACSSVTTTTISVTLSARRFEFRIVIMGYMADMKEQHSLCMLPNWHQLQGCSKCLTTGKKKQNGTVSYNDFFSITS